MVYYKTFNIKNLSEQVVQKDIKFSSEKSGNSFFLGFRIFKRRPLLMRFHCFKTQAYSNSQPHKR